MRRRQFLEPCGCSAQRLPVRRASVGGIAGERTHLTDQFSFYVARKPSGVATLGGFFVTRIPLTMSAFGGKADIRYVSL